MPARRIHHLMLAGMTAAALSGALIATPHAGTTGTARAAKISAPRTGQAAAAPAGGAQPLVVHVDTYSTHPEGYTPEQIRDHYEFDTMGDDKKGNPVNGTGQTIGIIMWGRNSRLKVNLQDFINTFDLKQMHGLTGKKCSRPAGYAQVPCFQTMNFGRTPPSDNATLQEESADVEWAHVAAPGANIILAQVPMRCKDHNPKKCGSPGNKNLDMAIRKVVQAGATVISMSYADVKMTPKQANTWDQLPAAFVSGEGDHGYPTAVYPAADPGVLSVGGTVITSVDSSDADTAWRKTGGGVTVEGRPGYQVNWTNSYKREVNDVAYDAVNFPIRNVMPAHRSLPWQKVWGVSVGIPQWAGLIADADQVRVANHKPILAGEGVMSGLYLAATESFSPGTIDPAYFTDVTKGCVRPPDMANRCAAHAEKGFDMPTGLGTPDAADLVHYLGYDS
jgi:subtilase family serine protease